MVTYVFLGWFSPLTVYHYEVIQSLEKKGELLVGPTHFEHDGKEVLTRTRPFSYEERSEMLESVGVDTISSYRPTSPYITYLLPQRRKKLIDDIREDVPEDSVFFTRDLGEAWLLELVGFDVEYEKRSGLSGTSVRKLIYEEIERGEPTGWEESVAPGADEIIRRKDTWRRLEDFCYAQDDTYHLFGFKVPMKGAF